MGYRPHIVEKYDVEYGERIDGFSWMPGKFSDFLYAININHQWQQVEEGVADDFIIPVKELENLKNIDTSKINFMEYFDDECDNEQEAKDLAEKVIKDIIKAKKTHCCKQNSEIRISFF